MFKKEKKNAKKEIEEVSVDEVQEETAEAPADEEQEETAEAPADEVQEKTAETPADEVQKPKKSKEFAAKVKKTRDKISVSTKTKINSMLKTFRSIGSEHKDDKFNLSIAIFKGGYVHNPVLTQVLGVCPIVMLATSVTNAVVLTAIVTMMLVACEVITSKFLKKVPRWVRVSFYTLVAAAVVTPICIMLMNSGHLNTAFSIYLPLVSVNGMLVIRCEKFACKTTVRNSFFDAIATCLGFGVVAVVVGGVRELFVSGSILGFTVANIQQLPSTSMAFITLVLLGFFSALHKWSVRRYFPDENNEYFDLEQVFEKISFSESGIQTGKNKDSDKALNTMKTIEKTEQEVKA